MYWRFYEVVATGGSRLTPNSGPMPLFGMPTNSRPAPLSATPFPPVPAPSPAPARAPAVRPAPTPSARPVASSARSSAPRVDPLEQDEVEAFKRALASGDQPGMAIPLGNTTPRSFATTQAHAPPPVAPLRARAVVPPAAVTSDKAAALAAAKNKLLLTGYEETELPDPDLPVLSGTQYGHLH